MRIQLSILTAVLLFTFFIFVLIQPAWANREASNRTSLETRFDRQTSSEPPTVSLAISVTQTPTSPQTTIVPTATTTPITGSSLYVYVPAIVDTNSVVTTGDPVTKCGPFSRPSPSIEAEVTSTPAPTVTPFAADSVSNTEPITTTPPLTTTGIVSSTVCPLNEYESTLANLLVNSPLQQRESMTHNPVLTQLARNHAMDMAVRNYFGSVDPNGIGPNYRARQGGYVLPDYYGTDLNSNNLETTIAGFTTPEDVWSALSGDASSVHALGDHEGYRNQDEFGIGYAYVKGSKHERYWVIIIAKSGG